MSWMTSPVGATGSAGTADAAVPGIGSTPDICARLLRPEDLGEVVTPSLHPDESDAEVGRAVLHRVEHPFAGELHGEGVCAAVVGHLCPGGAQSRDELRPPVGDLHQHDPAELGCVRCGGGPLQHAALCLLYTSPSP